MLRERTGPRPFVDELPVDGSDRLNGGGRGSVPTIGGVVVDPAEVAAEVEAMDAEQAIAWAIEAFHPSLRFAVTFQKTSSVIIDTAHRIEPNARFFYLDTELLFPETYETRDRLAAHFGIDFDRFAGMTLAE